MDTRYLATTIAAAALITTTQVHAIDAGASVVQLRTDCTENGMPLANCFTDLATLNDWIFSVRTPAPSAASPVQVNIGPGTFTGSFGCLDSGYVTLQGAGSKNTIISFTPYPVSIQNCENLTFKDIKFKSTGLGIKAVGGTTFWHDVEVEAAGFYAWFEADQGVFCPVEAPGKHYWFNSRIINNFSVNAGIVVAYGAQCDESWFFGSEITMETSSAFGTYYSVQSSKPTGQSGMKGRGEMHIYGGVIRTVSNNASSTTTLGAIETKKSGTVHIHGSGIDILAEGANPIVALSAITGGEIHANETAYNLKTGAGANVKRVNKDITGHVHAPYVWETHSDVPFGGSGISFESVTGYDLAVVTTDSNGAQDHPHVVIFDANCTSKWFDTTLNQCR